MSTFHDAAIAYATRGWAVFPILPNKKTPATPHGFKDATTDPTLIAQFPESNLAIRTGNGLCVLDIDVKATDGEATLQEWEAAYAPLPRTYTVTTPSGGRHYYFTTSRPVKTKAGIGLGVDMRGEGGYVVAPPSLIDGKPYALADETPPALIPDWLAAKLQEFPRKTFEKGTRNVTMTSVAGALRRVGVGGEALQKAVEAINTTLPEPLPETEIATIAGSVAQYPPAEAPPWLSFHIAMTGKSQPICNADAALAVLEQHPLFHDAIWFDTFRNRLMTTWGKSHPAEWQDTDTQRLLVFLQRDIRLVRLGKDAVLDALGVFGTAHRRHEVADWLKTLVWDETPRIDTWLTRCFSAPDTTYLRAASRNFWISLAARISRPGCQVDHMLVLEGPQGQGKTSALRLLGGPWYLAMHESVLHKDFFQLLPGRLIVEIDELDSFQHAEVTRIKQIISTPSDSYRAAYGRMPQTMARQCVFVGTTNDLHYLRDMTGNRRFWPIPCGTIDLSTIQVERELCFAEAFSQFKMGTRWWDMPEETTIEQEARREEDAWEPPLRAFLLDRVDITIAEALTEGVKVPLGQIGRSEQRRVAAILRKFGWERQTVRQGDQFVKRWMRAEREPGVDEVLDDTFQA